MLVVWDAPTGHDGMTGIANVMIRDEEAPRRNLWKHKDPERDANARLIAAAPAMLEALKAWVRGRATCPTANGADLDAWDKARAAIAAATGQGD